MRRTVVISSVRATRTEAQIEEYWQLGCQVLNLLGTDTSTYLEGLKARAGRAHARLQKGVAAACAERGGVVVGPARHTVRLADDGGQPVAPCAPG